MTDNRTGLVILGALLVIIMLSTGTPYDRNTMELTMDGSIPSQKIDLFTESEVPYPWTPPETGVTLGHWGPEYDNPDYPFGNLEWDPYYVGPVVPRPEATGLQQYASGQWIQDRDDYFLAVHEAAYVGGGNPPMADCESYSQDRIEGTDEYRTRWSSATSRITTKYLVNPNLLQNLYSQGLDPDEEIPLTVRYRTLQEGKGRYESSGSVMIYAYSTYGGEWSFGGVAYAYIRTGYEYNSVDRVMESTHYTQGYDLRGSIEPASWGILAFTVRARWLDTIYMRVISHTSTYSGYWYWQIAPIADSSALSVIDPYIEVDPSCPWADEINLLTLSDPETPPSLQNDLSSYSPQLDVTMALPDNDLDGLTDYEEENFYATDINNPDTDGDLLSDGDEVHVYGTSPTLTDSDNDGLGDYDEILVLFTDPLRPGPFHIDGDDEMENLAALSGWSGSGSELHPYVIENYNIDVSGSDVSCFDIRNIQSTYFIIRNCTVQGATTGSDPYYDCRAGIYLENVIGAELANNTCIGDGVGIYLQASPHNVLTGNNISHCNYGIYVEGSPYTTIDGFEGASKITGYSGESVGIYIDDDSDGVIIYDYYVMGFTTGIQIEACLSLSIENRIVVNYIADNEVGISLIDTIWCTIRNNIITRNSLGISVNYGSTHNYFYFNMLIDNTIQTFIEGPLNENTWLYGGEYGNFWSNYWGIDENGDGLGDTDLPHEDVDSYPIVDPSVITCFWVLPWPSNYLLPVGGDFWSADSYVWLVWRSELPFAKAEVTDPLGNMLSRDTNEIGLDAFFVEDNSWAPGTTRMMALVVASPIETSLWGDYVFQMTALADQDYSMEWFVSGTEGVIFHRSVENCALSLGEIRKAGMALESGPDDILTIEQIGFSGSLYIDGDSDFVVKATKYGWLGSGTQTDPYIIENYNIDINGADASGIEIRNILSTYFIIRGCAVQGATAPNYIFPHNIRAGIYLYNVVGCNVTHNVCTGNFAGIYLNQTTSCYIVENECFNNIQDGIDMGGVSTDNHINANYCHDNGYDGIFIWCDCSLNTISQNNCSFNGRSGITLVGWMEDVGGPGQAPTHNRVSENNCTGNDSWGISVRYLSDENVVESNLCSRNGIGIFLRESSSNIITRNILIDNTIQAEDVDSEFGNYWYHPTLLEGNIWSDYIGVDLDGNGIGDTDVPWPEFGYDLYPLVMFDQDGDGISDSAELIIGTDPENPDSDFDLIDDGLEWRVYFTDPLSTDSDMDGWSDYDEIFTIFTDPTDPGPFYIDGDDELEAMAAWHDWPGSGIQSDPYIIENYNIDVNGADVSCIEIRNILSTYFTVRYCTIQGASFVLLGDHSRNGIYLYNVVGARLLNNTCFDNAGNILLNQSSYCFIVNNTCYGSRWESIALFSNCVGNTVENNLCSDSQVGIGNYFGGGWNTIANNTCFENEYGILLFEVVSDTIIHNTIIDCDYGIEIRNSNENTITENTCSNTRISSGIYLRNSDLNTITGNELIGNFGDGISIGWDSVSNTVSNNNCTGNFGGISMFIGSSWNTVVDNFCNGNSRYGIAIGGTTDGCIISRNLCMNNELGISVYFIEDYGTYISENNCTGNYYGIYIRGSGSTVDGNFILGNFVGIYLDGSSSNVVFHNFIIDNTIQALEIDSVGDNFWYNPELLEGNVWSDYIGMDFDRDGIGDTDIPWPGLGFDLYPLVTDDFDNDGLSYYTELVIGTDPENSDTDGDLFDDGDEWRFYFTDPLTPETPQEVTEVIDSSLQELVNEGVLEEKDVNPMIKKLDAAIALMDKGKLFQASQKLNDFIDQINAQINSGRISEEEGNALIALAQGIIDVLLTMST